MRVRKIQLHRFMSHDSFQLSIPERGIVLVVGENGSGKSSILEAVAWAGWGDTLRGTPPHREGVPCEVCLETDEVTITRKRSAKGTGSLSWSFLGDLPTKYLTKTKADIPLEEVLGSWDVWRHSHVFSSADAMLFTLAPDRSRKKLLETILGLERFDRALERCRKKLKKENDDMLTFQEAGIRIKGLVESEARRVEEAKEGLALAPPLVDDADTKEQLAALTRKIAEAEEQIAAVGARKRAASKVVPSPEEKDKEAVIASLEAKEREAATQERERQVERRGVQKQIDGLADKVCPTCKRPFENNAEGKAHREKERARLVVFQEDLLARADQAAKQAKDAQGEATICRVELAKLRENAQKAAAAACEGFDEELDELQDGVVALQSKQQKLRAELAASKSARQQRERLEGIVMAAQKALDGYERQLKDTREAFTASRRGVALYEAAEMVLGLRGVRAQILTDALAAIEAYGNIQLAKLGAGHPLTLSLKSYRDKKDGKGVTDAISLDVIGAGGGRGYRGASGGERRRLDVAILLAIAEVAQAAAGREGGTLFFDEALDALDEDGVDAVAILLQELAQERAVVVITHNQALSSRLRPTQRIHLSASSPQAEAAVG